MQLNNKVTMKELVEGLHQALRPAYTEAPTLRHDFFSNELFGVILILNYQHKTLHSLFFWILAVPVLIYLDHEPRLRKTEYLSVLPFVHIGCPKKTCWRTGKCCPMSGKKLSRPLVFCFLSQTQLVMLRLREIWTRGKQKTQPGKS